VLKILTPEALGAVPRQGTAFFVRAAMEGRRGEGVARSLARPRHRSYVHLSTPPRGGHQPLCHAK